MVWHLKCHVVNSHRGFESLLHCPFILDMTNKNKFKTNDLVISHASGNFYAADKSKYINLCVGMIGIVMFNGKCCRINETLLRKFQ